ncbi:winged helix-turn-helix domain-containing protein [Dietzia maris]|uniref:winged helix-turn-helix domain-containing protein n=1 Tax=Dietzia sp. Die43 TaxID=2926011 RepID=UPI0035ABE136
METGGGREMNELLRVAEKRLKGKLRPGDYNGLTGGEIRWRNAMRWERNSMAKEGLIKRGSPRGWWELADRGRK